MCQAGVRIALRRSGLPHLSLHFSPEYGQRGMEEWMRLGERGEQTVRREGWGDSSRGCQEQLPGVNQCA